MLMTNIKTVFRKIVNLRHAYKKYCTMAPIKSYAFAPDFFKLGNCIYERKVLQNPIIVYYNA